MKLTYRQQQVLAELIRISRRNSTAYIDSSPYCHAQNLENIHKGDNASVRGMGGRTFQIGHGIGLPAKSVLSALKSLESKGLVIRETRNPTYKRALYWWPVGLAEKLASELGGEQP